MFPIWDLQMSSTSGMCLFNDNTQASPGAVKADCGFNAKSDILWSTGLARFPAIHHIALSCRLEVSLRLSEFVRALAALT